MDAKYLIDNFGGRLAFHGAISTGGALAFGTVDDVIKDLKYKLDALRIANTELDKKQKAASDLRKKMEIEEDRRRIDNGWFSELSEEELF